MSEPTEIVPPSPPNEETEPLKEEVEPVKEEVEPVQEEVEPVQEEVEPVQEEVEPVQEETEPVKEEVEPVQEETEPVQEETEPVKEEVEPVKEEVEPVQEEVESLKEEVDSLNDDVETIISLNDDIETMQEETADLSLDTNQVVEDVKTLSSIIGLIVATNSDLQEYNMDISPKLKSILEKLLNEFKYFDQVEEYLKAIIKDNKLDAKDVPIVMLLLTELYERLQTFSMEDIRSEDCADLLKIMFEIAIKEKIIKIASEDLDLLSAIYNIIDTSVKLIKTPNSLDEVILNPKRGLLYCLTHYICNVIRGNNKKEDD